MPVYKYYKLVRTGVSDRSCDTQNQDFRLEKDFPDARFFGALGDGCGHSVSMLNRTRFRCFVVVTLGFFTDCGPFRFGHRGNGQRRDNESNYTAHVIRHSPSL